MSGSETWHAVDVQILASAAEAAESAFNVLGALGTEIDSLRKKQDDPLTVTGFFDSPCEAGEIRAAVEHELSIYGISPDAVLGIRSRVVEETDWLAEWKKHWRPTEIGRFVIAPPWESVEDFDRILIRIEPNMAFGTGTHETTQLCLHALSKYYHGDQTFLDVGTGTGILAIAAAKLGGTTIMAVDTDTDSVRIARENAAANDVREQIVFLDGSIDDHAPTFDFVCANLTLDVIVPILPLLLEKCRRTLLLSGILVEQRDDIAAELEKYQISDLKFETAGEWIAVTARFDN